MIVAAGAGAFGPNRPPLAHIESYEGRNDGTGVHYLVRKREDFRGKRLVIAGGGDSALDWTLSLNDLAERIYVVHRRAQFRAAPELVARLQALAADPASPVELVIPYQLSALEGGDGHLSAVMVQTLEGEARRLEADALLAFFGLSMNLGPIADLGPVAGQAPRRGRSLDLRDLGAWHLCDRRHRHLPAEAEADPERLRRGGAGGPRDPSALSARPGAALGVLDHQRRAGGCG